MSQMAIHRWANETTARPGTAGRSRWIQVLCLLLLGYALAGKGFGYLGYPPVFIGELVLLAGMIVLLGGRRWRAVMQLRTTKLLLILMLWVRCHRAVPGAIRPDGPA